MTRLSFYSLVLVLAASSAFAGTEVIQRKEFRQDTVYPYVFRPVPYLVAEGPVAMRTRAPGPECGHRYPPALPVIQTIIEETVTEEPATAVTQAPVTTSQPAPNPITIEPSTPVIQEANPAYPAPQNPASLPPADGPDFRKIPDEVIEYFENPNKGQAQPNFQYRFFDPIFQPASPQKLPESKATYRQE